MSLDPRVIRQLAVWPASLSATGGHPVISDGYHSRADLAEWTAYRAALAAGQSPAKPTSPQAIRVHRGVDILWKRAAKVSKEEAGFPFGSPLFYAPQGEYERPIVAVADGKVFRATDKHHEGGKLTGGAVILEHDEGVGTAYHHLARVYVAVGDEVRAGQLIGIMGGSPHPVTGRPIGLVHLHFDLAIDGRFVDPEPYLRPLRGLSLEQVWGEAVSVGQPDDNVV